MTWNAGDDGHFATGSFDSLSAVELANAVSEAVNMRLPGTLVFDYPSVKALAAHVQELLAARFHQAEASQNATTVLSSRIAIPNSNELLIQVNE